VRKYFYAKHEAWGSETTLSYRNPPVKPPESIAPEAADPTARREASKVWLVRGTKS
jgi:hypothetical protein